ncbi:outer membrane protein [Facilibium subflavum]|uniref:outer membrane protein n=1 Tax=Facilibium subflavum TaxID=2219058 RepID=UPI001F24FEFA|nr:outer membrane beta-barrel protein [Facilibium subflavum]
MMKKIIATSIVTATLASGSAFAAGAQTGVVIGGDIGYTMPSGYLKDIDPDSTADNKNGNIAGGIFIGYDMALSQMLSVGLELDGQYAYNLAKTTDSGITVKVSNLSIPLFLTGKFYIPNTGGLNLFGKAGYAYNRLNVSADAGSNASLSDNTNLWRPVVAGGVGYQLQQFNIFAQYQYNWLPYQGQNGGYSTLSLGLSYTIPTM